MKKLALFGGSFNPPGLHHRKIAESIISARLADFVMVLPCGSRIDKNYIADPHRKELLTQTFNGIENCWVNMLNIELKRFTSNYLYEKIFSSLAEELWHVVGADQLKMASVAQSVVHTRWENGGYVFSNFRFIVIKREGFTLAREDTPPNSIVLDEVSPISSTKIKELLGNNSDTSGLLTPEARRYIKKHSLFK